MRENALFSSSSFLYFSSCTIEGTSFVDATCVYVCGKSKKVNVINRVVNRNQGN